MQFKEYLEEKKELRKIFDLDVTEYKYWLQFDTEKQAMETVFEHPNPKKAAILYKKKPILVVTRVASYIGLDDLSYFNYLHQRGRFLGFSPIVRDGHHIFTVARDILKAREVAIK